MNDESLVIRLDNTCSRVRLGPPPHQPSLSANGAQKNMAQPGSLRKEPDAEHGEKDDEE